MAEVLVTGGTGAVGRFVCHELARTGHSPFVFARNVRAADRGTSGNIADLDDVRRTIREHGVTHVIHLAAAVGAV
jgi:nucleoside-diphosphate-sugar epimerase